MFWFEHVPDQFFYIMVEERTESGGVIRVPARGSMDVGTVMDVNSAKRLSSWQHMAAWRDGGRGCHLDVGVRLSGDWLRWRVDNQWSGAMLRFCAYCARRALRAHLFCLHFLFAHRARTAPRPTTHAALCLREMMGLATRGSRSLYVAACIAHYLLLRRAGIIFAPYTRCVLHARGGGCVWRMYARRVVSRARRTSCSANALGAINIARVRASALPHRRAPRFGACSARSAPLHFCRAVALYAS